MVIVKFLGPINRESLNLDVKSLKELSEVLNRDETLKDWLNISAVAVNDKIVYNINTELKSGDVVSLLPPVCGG